MNDTALNDTVLYDELTGPGLDADRWASRHRRATYEPKIEGLRDDDRFFAGSPLG
ncbi:hypothetical protein [Streptomyces spiralis]|uniref:hypothetical protein n=1 Tax=Streptomyces spiralis TaxID=66376 RepID=UPI00369F4D18